ncbi:hypothetical protein BJ875DRAFT_272777 [Amylocarpus encephaloides]|uniref:Mitochondrial transcription factor 1 n=1 Tax=Amylocarpus encephaloides TaxID=45428 RepID=A0A9P7YKB0_9HELO|nr:hypothetical protein BJ875DRAFT_272777 [Amylocarpus encephaloides]
MRPYFSCASRPALRALCFTSQCGRAFHPAPYRYQREDRPKLDESRRSEDLSPASLSVEQPKNSTSPPAQFKKCKPTRRTKLGTLEPHLLEGRTDEQILDSSASNFASKDARVQDIASAFESLVAAELTTGGDALKTTKRPHGGARTRKPAGLDTEEDALKAPKRSVGRPKLPPHEREKTATRPRKPKPAFHGNAWVEQVYNLRELDKATANTVLHLARGYGYDEPGVKRTKRAPSGIDKKRVHVLHPGLCDDILQRMKPYLTKHVGCDIIDINPGPAIWSSKVHEFLKPRSHILMEPETQLYGSIIQPLLDAPDSKYKLIPKSGVIWANLETVLDKEHLPHQIELVSGDPRLQEPNDTLLVLFNLSYWPKKSYRGFSSIQNLVTHQLMGASRTNSLFHKYGLVRVLMWVEDEDRYTHLPREIMTRKKSAMEAEISCQSILEIASSTTATNKKFRRDERIEATSTAKVLERMRAAGVSTPPGRESLPQLQLSQADISSIQMTSKPQRDLVERQRRFDRGDFTKYKVGLEKNRHNYTDEWLGMQRLAFRSASIVNRAADVDKLTLKGKDLILRQQAIHAVDSEEAQQERENLINLRRELNNEMVELPSVAHKTSAHINLDHWRMLIQDPPNLMYDRREYEPLRVSPQEFFPNHELALLDFQPRPLWPCLREDYSARFDIFEYIYAQISSSPSSSIQEGLKVVWPGFAEWLEVDCPSLRDPTKGGDPDLNISVRCLSVDLYEAIVESWLRWPVRPTRMEMLRMTSSNWRDFREGDWEPRDEILT